MNGIKWGAALAAICSLSLTGCEDSEGDLPVRAQAVAPLGPVQHEGPGRVYLADQGFSFVPPAGWSEMKKIPPAFVAYGMPPENGFTVNMNANSTPDSGMPLDRAPAELKAAMPKMFSGWRCAEDGFVQIGGRRAYRLCSELQMNQVPLKLLQFIVIGDKKKVYTISFTAGVGQYDNLKATFDQCANTILVD